MPIATAAGIAAAGSVAAAGIGAMGASSAAGAGSAASQQAAADQLAEYQLNYNNQNPFIEGGYTGLNALTQGVSNNWLANPMSLSGMPTTTGVPAAPSMGAVPQYGWDPASAGGQPAQFSWNPTMQGLANTPGYQFQLQQGLESAQNSFAARGLGVSGAAMKGAEQYATGLASQTYNQQLQNAIATNQQQFSNYGQLFNQNLQGYNAQLAGYGQGLNTYNAQLAGYGAGASQFQNQFNDYWANQNNRYNALSGLATMGANASVQAGSQGNQAFATIGNALQTAGGYQAQGAMNTANALSGNLTSGIQNYLQSPAGVAAASPTFAGQTGSYNPLTISGTDPTASYLNAPSAQAIMALGTNPLLS